MSDEGRYVLAHASMNDESDTLASVYYVGLL